MRRGGGGGGGGGGGCGSTIIILVLLAVVAGLVWYFLIREADPTTPVPTPSETPEVLGLLLPVGLRARFRI